MPRLRVTAANGETREVTLPPSGSLMQALRAQGFDDIQAVCGGNCACATCHVQFDPAHFATLVPMASDEDDLLDCSDHRATTSRLSCQVPVTDALEGAHLIIPPEG